MELLPDSRPDLSPKEEFLLHRRLRQCWRTGDFSVAKQIVARSRFEQLYSDFYISITFCQESSSCEMAWCRPAAGLVTTTLKMDQDYREILTLSLVSTSCVAIIFSDQHNGDNNNCDMGMRTLACIDLSADEATVRWVISLGSNIQRFWYRLESYRGKLYLVGSEDSHRILETVSLDSGETFEILRIPNLQERHLASRNMLTVGGFDENTKDRLTNWLMMDYFIPGCDPDREVYLINTETDQVDHVVKLAQFSHSELFFFGDNLLSLPSDSRQGAKAKVHQLPDLKLLYEFPWERSWGNPLFDHPRNHYFYDSDLRVMHWFSNAGRTHLQIPFDDLDYYKTDQLVADTMIYEYIDEAPGLLTFVPLPLVPQPDLIKHAVPLIERHANMGFWRIMPLSGAILVFVDITCLQGFDHVGDEVKELVFWLKPNIHNTQKNQPGTIAGAC